MVRICIKLSLVIFLPGIIVAIFIAVAFGGTLIGPITYNPISNFISDMGSRDVTPAPFLLDSIEIICAFLLLPVFLFLHRHLLILLNEHQENSVSVKISKVTAHVSLAWLLVGLVGFCGVGIFSEDWSFGLHWPLSAVTFTGFAFGACFYGFTSVFNRLLLPRWLGLVMILAPITSVIIYGIIYYPTPNSPLLHPLEWIMLFCIFWWIIPTSFLLLRELKKEGS